MEDTVSRTSQDSAADEFVVVSTEPKLHIAGNGGTSELERKMTEVLKDDSCAVNSTSSSMAATNKLSESTDDKLIMSSSEVQQRDVAVVVESSDASDKPESGNSFNNLNTSTNTAAGPGKHFSPFILTVYNTQFVVLLSVLLLESVRPSFLVKLIKVLIVLRV